MSRRKKSYARFNSINSDRLYLEDSRTKLTREMALRSETAAEQNTTWSAPPSFNSQAYASSSAIEYNIIEGTKGADRITGTHGNDRIYADEGDDYVRGRWGDDVIYGQDGNDELYGDDGDDHLYGGDGNDSLSGGEGDDTLDGSFGNDFLSGGGGHDRLEGGYGDDVMYGGDGDDFMMGDNWYGDGEGNDWMYGGDGDDTMYGHGGNDYMEGGDGHDSLNGDSGDDILKGGAGNDSLFGGMGNDELYGGAGDDQLSGQHGNNILDGGAGNDTLWGGHDSDIFIYGAGYGHDVISDSNNPGERDVIRLKDLQRGDIEFCAPVQRTSPSDLVIRIKATGETLTIYYGLPRDTDEENHRPHILEFADGSILELTHEVIAGSLSVYGTADNDTMYAPDNYDDTGLYGGGGDDSIFGSKGRDRLYGQGGDDHLLGQDGNDSLYGGAGQDSLSGGNGDDLLDGGAGNDTLDGGKGNDIFVFGRGYGHDTVNANDYSADRRDMVRLLDLGRNDVDFLTTGAGSYYHNLVIRIKATGETLTISKAIYSSAGNNSYSIQAIEFGDGSVMEWSELETSGLLTMEGTENNDNLSASRLGTSLYGLDGDDRLYGGTDNDALYGGAGDDQLSGGAGNDLLDGGADNDTLDGGKGNDIFVFGRGYGHDAVNAHDSSVDRRDIVRLVGLGRNDVDFLTTRASSYYHNLVIRIKATGETLTITNAIYSSAGNNSYSIQAIEFGDGSVMEWNELETSGLLTMEGAEANDSLTASRLGTTMYGFDGNDTLNGGVGNDKIYGGEGDDNISGKAGNDILDGGAGNDTLNGGAGDDTYLFRAGDGVDTITNSGGGNDLLNLIDLDPAALWFGKSGNHLQIGLVGSSDKVTVNNWYAGDYKIDTIQAGDYAITEDQVAQMVQALAAVGAPAGVDGMWTDEQREALNPIISTYWQPKEL